MNPMPSGQVYFAEGRNLRDGTVAVTQPSFFHGFYPHLSVFIERKRAARKKALFFHLP
jgi:hypothetical protein